MLSVSRWRFVQCAGGGLSEEMDEINGREFDGDFVVLVPINLASTSASIVMSDISCRLFPQHTSSYDSAQS
jgi:hypothetical protein